MILLVLSLLVAEGNLANGEQTATNKTGKLVDKIRRQLMENNYDYLPSEEEVLSNKNHFDQDMPNDHLYNDNDTLAQSIERQDRTHIFVPRVKEFGEDSRMHDPAVSKKDLLYYVDDESLRKAGNNNVDEAGNNDVDGAGNNNVDEAGNNDVDGAGNNNVDEAGVDFDDDYDSNHGPKYKVLKVKSVDPNRRSLSYRRFIQEQNEDGVAIISLDGEPFPEFHLPRGRRQYMLEGESGELVMDARNSSPQGVDDLII